MEGDARGERVVVMVVSVLLALFIGFLLGGVTVSKMRAENATPTPIASPTLSFFDEIASTPRPTPTLRPTPRPTPTLIPIIKPVPTPRHTPIPRYTPRPTPTPKSIVNLVPTNAPTFVMDHDSLGGLIVRRNDPSNSRGKASVIIGASANVRSGPSTDYRVLEKVLGGAKVYCLDNGKKYGSEGWYKVRTEKGTIGYVSPKLIAYGTTAATARPSSGGSGSSSGGSQRMVYVSRTGHAYHCDPSCWGMINPMYMTEAEARAMGRTKCSYCW